MNKLLLNSTQKICMLFSLIAMIFSFQSFAAEDTDCGDIADFEFSNGSSTVTINNDDTYYIGDLPNNFYVDLLVNGFSESASFEVKNKTTNQTYNIGENYLPYTFPAGGGAWNFGHGEFEVKAKIFKYNNCEGSYCDSETIKFEITNTPQCGSIAEYQFSNGTDSVSIIDEEVYSLDQLPANFYLDLLINGFSESASFKLKNKDTGDEYTLTENNLPYTVPGGNAAWSYGTGEFEIEAKIYEFNNAQGSYCDSEKIKFTIIPQFVPECGDVTGFVLTDGVTSIQIVDGDSYDINALPANFYVGVMLSGFPESVRFEVKNEDTGDEFVTIDNDEAFTYPSNSAPWNLGVSEFKVKAEIYDMDNAMGNKCDYDYLKFTLYDGSIPDCPCQGGIFELTFAYSGSGTVTTSSGTLVDNGDGTYTATATGDKLESSFEIYVDGATAQIHTSCSLNLLGVTFSGLVQVIGYIDKYGNAASLEDGCGQASDCGTITGFEFSNFSSDPTLTIVDGGSYDINNIPTDFNINVLTSGIVESAFNTLTNVDTGEVYTKLENVVPYTFPGATNQVWNLGCGTFSFNSSIYKYNNADGAACDSASITFTITNCQIDCGLIDEFAFSNNGADANVTITDGETYNIADLPTDFYVDAIVAGPSESVRLTVTNLDTNDEFVIVENFIPYTYPAGGAAWSLGLGQFELKAEVFEGNYCNSDLCDLQTITFTLADALPCLVDAGTGTPTVTTFFFTAGTDFFLDVVPTGDAVVSAGYNLGLVLTQGDGLVIQELSDTTSILIPTAGQFTVHMFVYDPTTLDLSTIILGTTTAFDVLDLIANNNICAALDTVGSPITAVTAGPDERVDVIDTRDETKADVETVIEVIGRTNQDILGADVKLFPNPVANQLNIEINLSQNEEMNYSMVDLNGKLVLEGNLSSNFSQIQTKDLADGLYILKLRSNTRSFTKKILVKH